MKTFFIKSSLILGFIILLLATSGVALAVFGPFHPGNIFFPVQYFAEQQITAINPDPIGNATYLLELMDRRVNDLDQLEGSKNELRSIQYLEVAIDQAIAGISRVPLDKREDLQNRLISLTKRTNKLITPYQLAAKDDQNAYSAFESKISTILQMTSTEQAGASLVQLDLHPQMSSQRNLKNKPTSFLHAAKGLIPFPAGSQGAIHSFYSLVGQHETLLCKSCHNSGKYAGTPNTCLLCHLLKLPAAHYTNECGVCHTPVSWKDIHFDHASVSTEACGQCHSNETPVNHYNGECSACHISQTWDIVTFNHEVAGAVDCRACHDNAAPANHFSGQCSNCHDSFDTWANANFNHSGYSDCIACHAGDAPANHYQGQCSACHNTNSWQGAVFSHNGLTDCISCHSKDRPDHHDTGQCSECHNTSKWDD